MKQIIQSLENGEVRLITAPAPDVCKGHLLIHARTSLLSSGTERMLLDFGKASWLQKARQQPEKVQMVLGKIKTDGLLNTIESVRSKLQQPLMPGYCHVGVIAEAGADCAPFQRGDRVISNGTHADMVLIPKHLCARIPDNVNDETAAFTVVASIALQGIRLAQPTLGECVVVMGAGLIGLLTVQLLRAQGCRVLAIDFDDKKLQLAKQFGADICNLTDDANPVEAGIRFSRGRGVDAVLITASTSSSDPVSFAAQMSRKRGRIVLVGVSGLDLKRSDFYEKELSFQVSCSYGPGRYDAHYEKQGLDYPIGFVRWTEQRNFEAVLDLMANGQLNVMPMISHRFPFDFAADAYQTLMDDKAALGILLHYESEADSRQTKTVPLSAAPVFKPKLPVIGFIGAGNYASRVLIPAFKAAGAQCHTIVTSGGVSGVIHGEKAGFVAASTDVADLLANSGINTVVIATRHDSHADLTVRALRAGKHVFTEKPLALNFEELSSVEAAFHTMNMAGKSPRLMVGFNRRFSPHVQKIKSLLQSVNEPKTFIMTVNAGLIPATHWTQDSATGGGRIIGEACHFIDLMRFLVAHDITSVHAKCIGGAATLSTREDKAVITLGFADGSLGTIHYFSNGSASFPKERIEIFTAGRILQLDNFRQLRGFGWPGFRKMNLWRQDKGQRACVAGFLQSIAQGREMLIPFNEIIEVAKISIQADQLLREGGA